MKQLVYVLLTCVTLFGCGKTETVFMQGPKGDAGAPGENGHSLVSQYVSATTTECPSGGDRLDIYLDKDDDLAVSSSDSFMNSIIACNGANGKDGLAGKDGLNGLNGAPGPQGVTGAIGPQGVPGVTGAVGPTGPMGPQGPQGIQGPAGSAGANVTAYVVSSCMPIGMTGKYAKKNGSGNYDLYSSNTCSGSSKFATVSQGETYWLTANDLASYDVSSLRVIHFN